MPEKSTVQKALVKDARRPKEAAEPTSLPASDPAADTGPDTNADVPRSQQSAGTRWFVRAALVTLLIVAAIGAWLAYAYFRANDAVVAPGLSIQHLAVIEDGQHLGATDLIYWRGAFYLVHEASEPQTSAGSCKIVLHRSPDASAWEQVAEFVAANDADMNRPKFAAVANRLYLYASLKTGGLSQTTAFTFTENGTQWPELKPVGLDGWVLWRPKTRDGITWYASAHDPAAGKSAIARSGDGESWEIVSVIHEAGVRGETALTFLPDGRMLTLAGMNTAARSAHGDKEGHTILATSAAPYTQWETQEVRGVFLYGPDVIQYRGEYFAIGGRSLGAGGLPTDAARKIGRMRMSLYKLTADNLTWVSDLPSAGATSYAGAIVQGDALTISYYTSDTERDWPRFIGEMLPTEVRVARIELPTLAGLHPAQ